MNRWRQFARSRPQRPGGGAGGAAEEGGGAGWPRTGVGGAAEAAEAAALAALREVLGPSAPAEYAAALLRDAGGDAEAAAAFLPPRPAARSRPPSA